MKKLIVLYQSDRARNELLATDNAWSVRMFLQSQLNTWMVANGQPGEWKWADGIDIQPTRGEDEELPMDIMDGPLEIEAQETMGNKNARLQSYVQLRERNHKRMQSIARLALADGLGLGFSKQAVPAVKEKLQDLLMVCVPDF